MANIANLSSTTPPPVAGNVNFNWQTDNSTGIKNTSAYFKKSDISFSVGLSPIDIPPSNPNSSNDEFNASDGTNFNPSLWTNANLGGGSAVQNKGWLDFTVPKANSSVLRSLTQQMPAAPWSFYAKCIFSFDWGSTSFPSAGAGICMLDSGTHYLGISVNQGTSSTNFDVCAFFLSGGGAPSATIEVPLGSVQQAWIRMDNTGSFGNGNFNTFYSEDGTSWIQLASVANNANGMVSNSWIGISVNNGSSTTALIGHFDYFRRIS